MEIQQKNKLLEEARRLFPRKFVPEEEIFKRIHRGNRIFIGTGCGEPVHLVRSLIQYVESNPNVIFDAEVFHVWTLGVAPYTDQKFKCNFRHNSFFVGETTREAVNKGLADYTPVFLSEIPRLFYDGDIRIDVALIQTSPPDEHGNMSLGVSVDIVKAAVDTASLVIAQVNSHMPRVHGDGFVRVESVDFIVPYDEPILEYREEADDEVARGIGKHVSRIIEDGDTIEVGYGSIPNAILSSLNEKKHLGVHTELLTDGIVALMKKGVVDNTQKSIDRGKTVAAFCMGTKGTYEFINDNPSVEFRTVQYTNSPMVISRHDRMVSINSALEIDLTGQATAESRGAMFYSGIGGQADFMRGTIMARNGKTILAIQSTAEDGTVSRIVPFLKEGTGVTLNRGDVHYVVTEYGIAYLHGKNIRERAMELISIAHPKFRQWLIKEAKKRALIYPDQAFVPGKKGEYPEHLETYRTTKTGLEIFLRPSRITDEHLLKDFFYSLSDNTMYQRFVSLRKDMPHERIQELIGLDYSAKIVILAILREKGKERTVGLGQFSVDKTTHTAECAFVITDSCQNCGIGTELLSYLMYLAKRQGLLCLNAEVLIENAPMLHIFCKAGFEIDRGCEAGMSHLKLSFKQD